MKTVVSKSHFKPRALKYFRQVQTTGLALIITDHGKPVLQVVPYSEDPEAWLKPLRHSVLSYKRPTEPVGEED